MKRILAPLCALLLLGACVTDRGAGPNQTMGTLLGAAAGGLVGSQIGGGQGRLAAVAAGTLLGAYAGNQIGAQADRTNGQAIATPRPAPHRHGYSYRQGRRDGYADGYGYGYRDAHPYYH